jgi:ABC-type phosphate transport system permease subunit
MKTSQLVVGLMLLVVAVLLLLLGEGNSATAGAVALGVLGLVTIAISRRK